MYLNYFLSPMLENITGMSFFFIRVPSPGYTILQSYKRQPPDFFFKINLREVLGFPALSHDLEIVAQIT